MTSYVSNGTPFVRHLVDGSAEPHVEIIEAAHRKRVTKTPTTLYG
jgi:hypothetical protein